MTQRGGVFIGTPSHDGMLHAGAHIAILNAHNSGLRVQSSIITGSLVCNAFNQLWATGLNARQAGVTHFCMLHTDVAPRRADWLQCMLALMEAHAVDVLACPLPAKHLRHVETSTATERMDGSNLRRLNVQDLAGMPPTFTAADWQERTGERLLPDVGCLLVDFRRPWVEEFAFATVDRIIAQDGQFVARTDGEDYQMGRWLHERGIPYGVTCTIPLYHCGAAMYTLPPVERMAGSTEPIGGTA